MSAQRNKRQKTITSFFTRADSQAAIDPATSRRAGIENRNIPGLTIHSNFVTKDEEASLLKFLDEQPWRTDLSRRTIHYGGTYCLMAPRSASPAEKRAIENTIVTAASIPTELDWLVDRMIETGLYPHCKRPTYCIVNEYLPSQGISAHVENFRFGEPVCSLTLGSGDYMRFHELFSPHDGSVRSFKAAQAPRTGRREDVWLPCSSLVALSGEARYKWQHEITKSGKNRTVPRWRRVSLTFRVEK